MPSRVIRPGYLCYAGPMNIRPATPLDSLLLSRLCMDVQNLHAQNHPAIFKVPERDDFAVSFFDEMLVDPAIYAFIAEEEEEPVGYILCRLVERPENLFTRALRYLLVDQISVRPAARGQGVGSALLQRAESLARELKLSKVQLDSWDFNSGAHAFFENLGFQKFNFRYWRDLPEK